MNSKDATRLRNKQDRIIRIIEDRGFDRNTPISEAQLGSPTCEQLRKFVWPAFEPSLDAFLEAFDGR